ncbi:hypothetical protein HYU93_05045 [Candidatus Daviesbacteria bacterium]|nr:hypothetical protein [Candidatus Daviesbacteria bacterium]
MDSKDLLVPLNLGIVGYGFVGQAVANGFNVSSKGKDIIRYYDKFKDTLSLEEVITKSEVIVVALPTPMREDESGIDLTILEEMAGEITKFTDNTDKIILIKSTVIPGTTAALEEKYPKSHFAFSPEFLTEANFLEDFINADRTIIGASNDLVSRRLAVIFKQRFPKTIIFQTDPTTAETVKYFANAYLSLKVTFANFMYDYCQKKGIKYEEVKKMAAIDPRIIDAHLEVTTMRGFGGKCLAPEERIFAFNSSKLKVIRAKNINNKVVGVLGWKDGKIIKDDLMIAGSRKVDHLLKFSLSKGRDLTVTSDHIMIVADKDGNLSQKEAFEVKKDDYIPVILDGLKEPQAKEHKVAIKLYKEVDLSKYKTFVENLPKSHAGLLKPYLSFHQYKSSARKRVYSVPLKACLDAGINIDSLRIKTNKTGTWVPAVIQVNEDFARLVGYYLSKGCVSDGKVFISFSFLEKDLILDVKNILQSLNIKFSMQTLYWQGHENAVNIKISSPILSSYFSSFGTNSSNKTIPYFIFHSNQAIKDNLLAGILRGDGSIFSSNMGNYWTVNLSTTSQILAEGVDALLREKGILANIGTVKTAKTKSYVWSLDVSERESVQKLLLLFTPGQRSKVKETGIRIIKSPAYSKIRNLALLNIKNIENIQKSSLVYSIETKNHYYITSWGILTHNCFPKDLVALIGEFKKAGVDSSLLETMWKYNKKIRKTHDWEEIPFVVGSKPKH